LLDFKPISLTWSGGDNQGEPHWPMRTCGAEKAREKAYLAALTLEGERGGGGGGDIAHAPTGEPTDMGRIERRPRKRCPERIMGHDCPRDQARSAEQLPVQGPEKDAIPGTCVRKNTEGRR
jgi:hypothetical protein